MPETKHSLNHVAILCESIDRAADYLSSAGFTIGPKEVWEEGGATEIYVGPPDSRALLLLIQPFKVGVYRRALEKRGPGLHHIAVDVPDLDVFLNDIASSGWLLHPKSMESFKRHRTLWLARPGFPALIEVQSSAERAERLSQSNFVTGLSLPIAPMLNAAKLLGALGRHEIQKSDSVDFTITIQGSMFNLRDLAAKSGRSGR